VADRLRLVCQRGEEVHRCEQVVDPIEVGVSEVAVPVEVPLFGDVVELGAASFSASGQWRASVVGNACRREIIGHLGGEE
jgi:hypothetical protein